MPQQRSASRHIETSLERFLELDTLEQVEVLLRASSSERQQRMRILALDDAADLVQAAPADTRDELLNLLDDVARREVAALLAYAEDAAGGLMDPSFVRLRPELSVDQAISYFRRQAETAVATLEYGYVLDTEQRLLGVVSLVTLFSSSPDRTVREVMNENPIAIVATADQEHVSQLFRRHNLRALPVIGSEGKMQGVVTVDDIVDVVDEEATEDMQKVGGVAVLDRPYLATGVTNMVGKRAGWLTLLFLGEMLTATAMGWFEDMIASAVVLALFVPLIISSGGNAGSQATTLVIRAMALGEVTARDLLTVVRREVSTGLALGLLLAAIGCARILLWQRLFNTYGEHAASLAVTVSLALVGVVLWGTVSGAVLPFALRAARLDPAVASAPFVATFVDVTGLIIYFTLAGTMLRGTLL
jgi:magnesium transporter